MLPNYVLAALLCTPILSSTWGSLGYVGGNVLTPSSSMQTPQFFNAWFDSRAVTDQSGNPVAKDANGYPAAAWQAVLSASNNGTNTAQQPNLKTGALGLTLYQNCELKTYTANPCTPVGNTGLTVTALTKVSDDGTIQKWTFTLNVTLNTNVALNGSAAAWDIYIPWDGSTVNNVLNPVWNPVWLAYNAQFRVLRLMDYLNTLDTTGGLSGIGKIGETKWSDPVFGRVPNLKAIGAPHSWETVFGFAKTVNALGAKPTPWINLPGYCDTNYATQCATLANTMGMPPMIVETCGDEPWNTAYTMANGYQYYGVQEAQIIANYGNGTVYSGISGINSASQITSITSNSAGDVTVTINDVMSTRLPLVQAGLNYTFRVTWGGGTNVWNSVANPCFSVTSNSFTYPTRGVNSFSGLNNGSGAVDGTYNVPLTGGTGTGAIGHFLIVGGTITNFTIAATGYHYTVGDTLTASPGGLTGFQITVASLTGPAASTTLTGIMSIQTVLNDTNKVASVTSDGASPPNITVTTNVPLSSFPFSVAVGVKLVSNNQQHSQWSVGSLASPATITAVTTNSFTFPSVNAPANSTMASTDQFACFIGQVASSGVGLDSDLVKSRPIFDAGAMSTAWVVRQTKRLRDAWIAVRPQDTIVMNQQAVSLGSSQPRALVMAAYFGSQPGSTYNPPASWLGGLATAPYNQLLSTPASVDAAFTDFGTNLAGSIGNAIEALSFWSHYYGVRPMVYEVGPDIQNAPALQVEISSDARIQSTVTSLLSKCFQVGVKEACYFQITPSAFIEGSAQGAWASQQTITDTFTNLKTQGVLSMLTQAESYATKNGTVPCSFPLANIQGSDNVSTNSSNASYPLGIKYFGATGTRDIMWLAASNSARTVSCVVPGTDSAANTQATVSIIQNGVTVSTGTVTLPQGGAGNSSSCTIGNSTSVTLTVPKGAFILSVGFATGQGTVPGIGGPPTLS